MLSLKIKVDCEQKRKKNNEIVIDKQSSKLATRAFLFYILPTNLSLWNQSHGQNKPPAISQFLLNPFMFYKVQIPPEQCVNDAKMRRKAAIVLFSLAPSDVGA